MTIGDGWRNSFAGFAVVPPADHCHLSAVMKHPAIIEHQLATRRPWWGCAGDQWRSSRSYLSPPLPLPMRCHQGDIRGPGVWHVYQSHWLPPLTLIRLHRSGGLLTVSIGSEIGEWGSFVCGCVFVFAHDHLMITCLFVTFQWALRWIFEAELKKTWQRRSRFREFAFVWWWMRLSDFLRLIDVFHPRLQKREGGRNENEGKENGINGGGGGEGEMEIMVSVILVIGSRRLLIWNGFIRNGLKCGTSRSFRLFMEYSTVVIFPFWYSLIGGLSQVHVSRSRQVDLWISFQPVSLFHSLFLVQFDVLIRINTVIWRADEFLSA